MPKWIEYGLTGGVVKTRHRQDLALNELFEASNVRMKPGDTGRLYRDVQWNVLAQGPVDGAAVVSLGFLYFEGTAGFILAVTGGAEAKYWTMPAGGGPWKLRATRGAGLTRAGVVRYGNQNFVGSDAAAVVAGDSANFLVQLVGGEPTFSQMGMRGDSPIATGAAVAAGTGSQWDPPVGETDWIVYYITEYDSVLDVESPVLSIFGYEVTNADSGKQAVLTSYGSELNGSRTTNYRIYRHYVGRQTATNDTAKRKWDRIMEQFTTPTTLTEPMLAGLVGQPTQGSSFTDAEYRTKTDTNFRLPLIFLSLLGSTSISERNRFPGPWTMGAEFQSSIVVSDGRTARLPYSPAKQPETMPAQFGLRFSAEGSDRPMGHCQVGEVLVVLLEGSVWAQTSLPQEGFADQAQGRSRYRISGNEGCVGPDAWAVVETEQGEIVVWLSPYGLRMSNGQAFDDACRDWTVRSAGLVVGNLSRAILRADPVSGRLRLFALTAAGTSQVWDFYYHPSLLKVAGEERTMLCLGPTVLDFAFVAVCRGGAQLFGTDGTRILVMDEGTPAAGAATVRTGAKWAVGRPFVHQRVQAIAVQHSTAPGTMISGEVRAGTFGESDDFEGIQAEVLVGDGVQRFDLRGVEGEWIRVDLTMAGGDVEWALGALLCQEEAMEHGSS